MFTYDKKTVDSAGVFFIGELERLDTTLHDPLLSVGWHRDIMLREDISIADETSSYTNSDFFDLGDDDGIDENTTEIPAVSVGIEKTARPLFLWGRALPYSVIELAAAAQVGRPLNEQKYRAMQTAYNMFIDRVVYIGSAKRKTSGLLNLPKVPPVNAGTAWSGASKEQILNDIDDIVYSAWEKSGFAVCPSDLLLPPSAFKYLTKPVTAAGSQSILSYLEKETLAYRINNGKPLDIRPSKWCEEAGIGGKTRACAYTNDKEFVRFPLVPVQHAPVEYRGLHQITTYFCKYGEIEPVYPETIAYLDGV